MIPRLKEIYNKEIQPELKSSLGLVKNHVLKIQRFHTLNILKIKNMIARLCKWLIKFGGPTYIIFIFIIVIYDIKNHLNYETIIGLIFMAPLGIIGLSPIGKFYHHCFYELKDYNRETLTLAKETFDLGKNIIKSKKNDADTNQGETANSEIKKVREKIVFIIKNKSH